MAVDASFISSRVAQIFKDLNKEDIDEILQQSEIVELDPGDYLMEQDDESSKLYFLLSGRLRSVLREGSSVQVLGDVGVGEPVGELAFFSGSPRSASVLAVRKSKALALTRAGFQTIVSHRPSFATRVNQFIISRLKRNALEANKQAPPQNIVVVKLDPEADFTAWSDRMLDYFDEQSFNLSIYNQPENPHENSESFFESLDNNNDLNFLVVDQKNLEWSRKILIYADLVVVATAFEDSPELKPIEQELNIYQGGLLGKKVYLLMLHENDDEIPQGTAQWLKNRNVNLAIHLRKNHKDDIGRFCRILTHKANGLVLGGGGAKGFAHIGVVKAMQEKGIPIDFIGGASAGALGGLTMAICDFDVSEIEHICQESVKKKVASKDLDIPLVSIMSGKKLTRFIREIFKKRDIEDLWVNSYCVSANLTKAELAVHERGKIWRKIRASISVPGVFPPVVIDNYLHVDGGVMDNLPIDPMYRYPVDKIYAVSLSGIQDVKTNYNDTPTSMELLTAKFSKKRRYKIPNISSIIVNSMTLNSMQRQEINKSKVSHYVELDLKGMSFLSNKNWKVIVDEGYKQTKYWLEGLKQ
ncbi:MAG TPA: patatin-like phospholipase family protein [Saprospiraceae bacterium]|nr:patatin-like phospholipase family protein [Saprospiraceae bacterium]